MKQTEFMALCGEYLIDPAIALECAEIREALARQDDAEVKRILEQEF